MKHFIPLALLACLQLSGVLADLSFTVLHTNDMHSRYEETNGKGEQCPEEDKAGGKCFGGFARIAHLVRKHRKLADEGHGPKTIFLNAGDTFTGSTWFNVHKSKIAADFINAIQLDTLCLGNHEFMNGMDNLLYYIETVRSPIVSSNVKFNDSRYSKVKKSNVLEVDGVKVGVIGYLTTTVTKPEGVEIANDIESIKAEAERLDAAGVKILIALGHSGFDVDQKIASQVPLIDIVVGGHSHTFLYEGTPPSREDPVDVYPKVITRADGKQVPVVQAYFATKYLGRLNVTFDDEGNLKSFAGRPMLLNGDVPQEEDILQLLETYRPELESLTNEVMGTTKVYLAATNKVCRYEECNLGNLIADAFVDFMVQNETSEYWTNYPIAFINGGGLQHSIDVLAKGGQITRGDILVAIPFANNVATASINGTTLLQVLEANVGSRGETTLGEFLQFSGLHVVYNMLKPPGRRVVSVKIRCGKCKVPKFVDLVPEETYNIVTLDFLLEGDSGFPMLNENAFNKVVRHSIVENVGWYLRKHSPVYAGTEERIRFIGGINNYVTKHPEAFNLQH